MQTNSPLFPAAFSAARNEMLVRNRARWTCCVEVHRARVANILNCTVPRNVTYGDLARVDAAGHLEKVTDRENLPPSSFGRASGWFSR